MSNNPYQPSHVMHPELAKHAAVEERIAFIRSTYLHLLGAVAGFVLIDAAIIMTMGDRLDSVVAWVVEGWHWLLFLGGFMVTSWVADHWARSGASRQVQYAGLSLYVVAEAILFVPLLYMADRYFPGAIQSAGIVTMVVFGGLTATVFITKADFSFLRMGLAIGGFAAMALIVVSIVGGFPILGTWFSIAMVVLASGCILYSTSNILHHYRTDQPVAAALALFASVALLFWYVLQLFMSRD